MRSFLILGHLATTSMLPPPSEDKSSVVGLREERSEAGPPPWGALAGPLSILRRGRVGR